jgi:osmotically-inducible protein OsmY
MFGYSGQTEADRYTRQLGSDRNRFWGNTERDYDREDRNERGGERGNRGRQGYWGRGWENEHDERSRYGNPIGGSGFERGYNESSSNYSSQRYNSPGGYRSGQRYGRSSNYDYDRDRYGRNENYGQGEDRGWWDRASDAVASWFGDEDAERRRQMDAQQGERRGRGPKGYRRSDERIKEDVNDRLSDDYYLDASEVEVQVENTEVTLTGTVPTRRDKRRAEDIADSVSGVTNVENRIRVKQSGAHNYSDTTVASGTSTAAGSPLGLTGTPGTSTSSAAAGGGTSRGRSSGD